MLNMRFGALPDIDRRLRDHEGRCRLWSVGFGVEHFTPEANVQDGSVSGNVWKSPKEILRLRVQYRRDAHCEGPAAI